MKNKKTILCMLLTLLLVCASLSGCGNQKSPTPAGTYVMQGAAEAFLAPHITFDPEDSSFPLHMTCSCLTCRMVRIQYPTENCVPL